jgi:anti-sigma B factor antagonist
MDLTITENHANDGRHLISLTGALDLASRGALLDAGRVALKTQDASALVVNLAGVDFFDSSGIGAIVELAGDAEDAAIAFSLQAPSPRVLRVLEIAGLLDTWPIEPATV